MARRIAIRPPMPHEGFVGLDGMGTPELVSPLRAVLSLVGVASRWRDTKMRQMSRSRVCGIVFVLVLLVGMHPNAFGRGGGGSMGRPPGGVGVDRGLGRASEASGGRADMGRVTAAEPSHGQSDAGLDRARAASAQRPSAQRGRPEHPGIAQRIHVTAPDLRSQYRAALATNPHLTFGQFVAATRLAHNLGGRDPQITRDAMLAGLAQGKSIGQTLQSLGLSARQAQAALTQAHRARAQSSKRT